MNPIIEGIVTTAGLDGLIHLAPMGPRVSPDQRNLLLRPFPASTTFRNLKARGEGVFHVTDDVLLLARAAVGKAAVPAYRPARNVQGFVLEGACRILEFRVGRIDESQERAHVDAEVVHAETLRDFLGFNRAKHAVIEAAILATRLHLIPREVVRAEFDRLAVLVEKTGGPTEHEAFAFLHEHLEHESPKPGTS